MRWMTEARRTFDPAALRAVRTTQALTLELLDRARVRPVALLLNMQLDVAETWVGDPARLVDESYATAMRFAALHREFVQRLFEVLDTRDDPFAPDPAPLADVLQLRADFPGR